MGRIDHAPTTGEGKMASWISIISAFAGILAGGGVTYVTSRAQLRIEAEHAYDRTLRDLRLPHYQQLFTLQKEFHGNGGHQAFQARWSSLR
jgi:hypothetical protein